jgi:polar amino acid transport system permease protein
VSPPSGRRQEFIRRRRRRSNAIAAASTAAAITALVVLVPRLPGWTRVKASFFDGDTWALSWRVLPKRFWYDVQIFLWSAPIIVVVALLVALARNVRNPALYPLKLFATLYTDLVRGVPVVLWIYLIGFGVPGLLQSREWSKPIIWATVALVLAYSAYVAEVFRSGIESIHESQRAAARSLGLSNGQTMRHVVLPQAMRRVVPPFMNDMVSLQKDVALVSFIGPVEALRQAQITKSLENNFTSYVVAAILFLSVSIPLTRLTDHLLQRERVRMSGTNIA